MAEAFFLTSEDRDIITQVVRWWKKRLENSGRSNGGDQRDHEEFPAPEVYAARTGPLGVPGADDVDTPGSADCDIYSINLTNGDPTQPTLVPVTPLSQTVYNLFEDAVPEDSNAVVVRDKFGRWIIISMTPPDEEEPGSGTDETPTPCQSVAKIKTTDCVVVHTGIKDYILGNADDPTPWTSDEAYVWDGGSGVFLFEWNATTGLADLFLGGLRLLNCGNGCYVGGPLTGHGDNSGNSCGGRTFSVCVECHCCPDKAWHGEAWYCVKVGTGVGTGDDQCEPLFVTEALACMVEICSGPYATYDLAAAVCLTQEAQNITTNLCDGSLGYFSLGVWYNATLVDDGVNCQFAGYFSTSYVVPADYKITFASITGGMGSQVNFRTRACDYNEATMLCPCSGNFTSGLVGVGCHAFDQGGQSTGTHEFLTVILNYFAGVGDAQVVFRIDPGTC